MRNFHISHFAPFVAQLYDIFNITEDEDGNELIRSGLK